MSRVEAVEKVTGRARYAAEYPVDGLAYAWPVQSAIACGEVRSLDARAALAMPGVIAVLSADTAAPFGMSGPCELVVFGSRAITYRGQLVAAVVADTLENAQDAAAAIRVSCEEAPHHVDLRAGDPGLYTPGKVNPGLPAVTGYGDVPAGLAGADAQVSVTYPRRADRGGDPRPVRDAGDADRAPTGAAERAGAVVDASAGGGPGGVRAGVGDG